MNRAFIKKSLVEMYSSTLHIGSSLLSTYLCTSRLHWWHQGERLWVGVLQTSLPGGRVIPHSYLSPFRPPAMPTSFLIDDNSHCGWQSVMFQLLTCNCTGACT